MQSKWHRGTSSLVFVLAAAAAGPAFAQDVAPQARSADDNSGLREIVVTARKVAERLQDVPVAVTAYDATVIEERNFVALSDIGGVAPGLKIVNSSPSGASNLFFSMRGQTQRSNLSTTDPSIGVYVDGVYWARAYGLNANLLDASNVQVLRGPQGTLFGRNTTGGAILLTSNDPKLDEFSGRITVGYGRFNYKQGTAIVNAPLVDGKLAARFAFQTVDDDGYVRDTLHPDVKYGETSNYEFRAKLLAQLSDDTSLVLSADIFREDRNPDTGQLRYVASNSSSNLNAGAEVLGAAACFANTVNCTNVGRARFADIVGRITNGPDNLTSSNIINSTEAKTNTYMATLNQVTPLGDLKIIGAYRDIDTVFFADYDGSESRITEYSGGITGHQWSVEATLTGKAFDDRLSYAAGLFYFQEKGRDQSLFAALTTISTALTRFNGEIDNKSIGIYGQADYKLTDKLTFTGGLRWSRDRKLVVIQNGTFTGTIYLPTPGSFVCTVAAGCPTKRSGKFSGVSWLAGLDYKFSPDLMVYAKASRAFRSGGVNLRETTLVNNLPPNAFKPEKLTAFEGGFKAEALERRLRFNLAAYYQKLDDAQREFILSSTLGNRVTNTTVAGNAKRVDFYGGEAEITARIIDTGTDRYTFSGNAAYVKPKYKDYTNAQTGFDKGREKFQYVSKWQFSASGTYEHDFEDSKLAITASYTWESAFSGTEFNFYADGTEPAGMVRSASDGSLLTLVDAQNLKRITTVHKSGYLDARASLEFGENRRYEVAIYGRNILNDRNFVLTGSLNTLGNNGVRRPPATYGVQASVKF